MVNADYVRFDSSIRSLQHSSISWDALTLELWPALIHGGCCILYPGRVPAPSELERIIKDYDVNTLWITSSLFNALMDTLPEALSGVGQVMTGGEALSEVHVRKALKLLPETHLVNGYGPSECVVFTCCYPIPKDLNEHARPIPIGKPIGDRLVYVLDRWMTLAQAEAEGELYVGGDSLARGYLGRPELTAERFVPHPYNGRTGERLYRTGDVVRRRADGLIEFVGRTDDQVKVRGYRIELGEINAALRRHPAVRECVVLVERESTLEKRLVAYIAVNPGRDISAADLRSYLKQRMPEYMIPAGFVLLPELPLKSTGKIDRQVLSTIKPAENEAPGEFVGPRTAIEEVIAGVWAEVLRTAHFGVHDNFFELGGHSLLAVHLVSRVREVTHVSLPVRCVFEAPTVAGMASRVSALKDDVGIRPLVARKGHGNSSLAAIQPNGSRTPFFCVHPADGNVFCYVPLSRMLGPDQPFYGLQSPGLDDDGEPYAEIEAAAADYITALRSVQPKGPYRLGGWSMGGVISFEMVRQLLECGEQVSRLILIDSFLPARSEAIIQETDQSLLAGFALNLGLSIDQLAAVQEELRLLDPDEQLNRILEMARESELAPPDINVSTIRRLRYVYDANVRAVNKYTPQMVPVQVTLLKASEPLSTDTESQVLEWKRWATLGVKIYEAPGNHFDMLREPNLKFLAKTLNDCLADEDC
jgi:thioesterase domain-containing protein